jgi:hypothetical protein
MKTGSTNLINHLAQEATTLTTCWEITRTDGTVIRLTELDVSINVPTDTIGSISVGGGRYLSTAGFTRTAIDNAVGLNPDTLDISGLLNSNGIQKEDVRAGLYDGADLKVFVVNYEALADGVIALKRGRLGEVTLTGSGLFQTEVRSLSGILRKKLIEKTSPTCRALLGDSRCTVPINPDVIQRNTAYAVGSFVRVPVTAGTTSEIYGNLIYECTVAGTTDSTQPSYDTTPGNTTVDGTATFKAYQAWTRHGSITSVTDRRVMVLNVTESRAVDDWFNGGILRFESGPNAGISMEVKDWDQSSNTVTLFLPMPFTPGVGNVFTISPGCLRTRTICKEKFAMAGSQNFANGNVINMRAEPDLPGRDFVLTYPDAK